MSTPIELNGTCDARFVAVRDAFLDNFNTFGETGAAMALVVDGKPVVDIWAGHRDQARTQPWTPDTIVNVYSTTKGMTAICANRLVDQGQLDLDAPVAKEKMGPNPETFGHGGMGGSMAFADPVAKVGFGYVINEMHAGLWLIDPRAAALIEAVYESL